MEGNSITGKAPNLYGCDTYYPYEFGVKPHELEEKCIKFVLCIKQRVTF